MHDEDVSVIQSKDPVLVTSYALGTSNVTAGGPYLTVVPGLNQYLPRYKVVIPTGFDNHYVAVMIRKCGVKSLRVNEESFDASSIRIQKNALVGDEEYSVIVAEVAEGELTIESKYDTPFGLMVYGSRENQGYGFAGNVLLR
jgi:hypothetical protein